MLTCTFPKRCDIDKTTTEGTVECDGKVCQTLAVTLDFKKKGSSLDLN
jgi:hypothetical protein